MLGQQGCRANLVEVAKRLNRTKGAVAGLIYRGLQRLRVLLADLIVVQS